LYEKEIEQTTFEVIRQDILREFEEANRKLKEELAAKTEEANKLRGELNQKKGEAGELWIRSALRNYSYRQRYFAPGELGNNTERVRFPRFREIDTYAFVSRSREAKIDILCQPIQANELYLAVEVKNRQAKQVGVEEIERFAENLHILQEHLGEVLLKGLFYSLNGFQAEALEKLEELKIFWWDFATVGRSP
jgi:hypothetical protein